MSADIWRSDYLGPEHTSACYGCCYSDTPVATLYSPPLPLTVPTLIALLPHHSLADKGETINFLDAYYHHFKDKHKGPARICKNVYLNIKYISIYIYYILQVNKHFYKLKGGHRDCIKTT